MVPFQPLNIRKEAGRKKKNERIKMQETQEQYTETRKHRE